ncbi:MAG: DedA family protein [Desulfobacterales bacterium]|nr:MAG: DedA family protein [Desulfobacterales bacterium]
MEIFQWIIDLFLHLDRHLAEVIRDYGTLTYILLFVIVFMETGLVVTPVLPGDSLLFAAGTLAAAGFLAVGPIFALCAAAAVTGDSVNYCIGHFVGPRIFARQKSRWFNPRHLDRTHEFYERYGGKTIILARFIPVIRTFAPFVAGIGAMGYARFFCYNVIGGLLWPGVCVFSGYFFGNLPAVKRHFSLVILSIIAISILPGVAELLHNRSEAVQKITNKQRG